MQAAGLQQFSRQKRETNTLTVFVMNLHQHLTKKYSSCYNLHTYNCTKINMKFSPSYFLIYQSPRIE